MPTTLIEIFRDSDTHHRLPYIMVELKKTKLKEGKDQLKCDRRGLGIPFRQNQNAFTKAFAANTLSP